MPMAVHLSQGDPSVHRTLRILQASQDLDPIFLFFALGLDMVEERGEGGGVLGRASPFIQEKMLQGWKSGCLFQGGEVPNERDPHFPASTPEQEGVPVFPTPAIYPLAPKITAHSPYSTQLSGLVPEGKLLSEKKSRYHISLV